MLKKVVATIVNTNKLFMMTVVVPVFVSIVYFGLLASDVYISESKFVVRSPEKPMASGIGVLLQSAGFANASEEVFAAKAFVESRDALRTINKNGAYERAYSSSDISFVNRFNPIGLFGTFEDLFAYYLGKVRVESDTTTSISTLTVRAYTPEEAQKINRRLLDMAEATVNRLNERGREDMVRFSTTEVIDAKTKAQAAAIALAAYRNRSGVVDPEKQAAVQIQMVSKLQDELIAIRMQVQQLQAFTPDNPQLPVLRERMGTLQQEIEEQMGLVAGDRKSLAGTAAQYQRLELESQFADKLLASAMASLEDARNEARRKQAYVERIVEPNLPDAPLEPRRLRGILATLALGLVAWGIGAMLLAGIKEHAQ